MDVWERDHELKMERERNRNPWAAALPWVAFWLALAVIVCAVVGSIPASAWSC